MINANIILILSASAPVMVFSHVFVGRYYQSVLRVKIINAVHSPVIYRELLEARIHHHFEESLRHHIVITCGAFKLEGYFKSFPNGEYHFYDLDHHEVLKLKKDHKGWGLMEICDGDDRKRMFIMPMILHLEAKLFN